MKKSLRIISVLVLSVFILAMNASAITKLGGSTAEKIEKRDWDDSGTMGFEVKLDQPMDISGMENIYLRMYLDNADNCLTLNNGQFELTSSGNPDVEESRVNPNDLDWKNGWNEFVIPISDFLPDGNGCDLTKFNFVRLYMFTDGLNCSVLDYIAVGNDKDDKTVLAKTDWAVPEKPSAEIVKPDIKTYKANVKGSSVAALDNSWGTPIDVSKYESAYIGIYVSDMDKYTTTPDVGQVEFGSKYIPDAEEDSVLVDTLDLQTGWNYIEIPLDGMNCDYTRLNHFRIYMFIDSPDEEVEVKLDYLAFGPAGLDVGEGKAASFPLVVIKPLAEREVEEAAAAAAAEGAVTGSGETQTNAPATADFGIAISATLLAAACVTIAVLKKRK